MFKGLPTILVVTTVALAIWIVAEAESVRTETFSPTVGIDPSGSGGHMARADPDRTWPTRVTVTAEGSAASLDALRRAFISPVGLGPGTGRGLRAEPGVYTQDLREAIASLDAVKSIGVTIASVEPPTVSVEVAEQDSMEVPIELVRDGLNLESDPIIRPDRVTITGPRNLIALLRQGQSRALIRLARSDLDRLIPGQAEVVTGVRVELPSELATGEFWGASPLNPATVDVSLTLRAQSRSLTIPSVSVLLAVAPVDFNDWDVLVDDQSRFLKDVTLTGPSEVIGQYERGERRVDAFVRLTFQELTAAGAAGSISREAEIGPLPAGVSAACEDRTVDMRVKPRELPAPVDPAPGDNG